MKKLLIHPRGDATSTSAWGASARSRRDPSTPQVYFSILLSAKVGPFAFVIGTTLGAVVIAFIVGVILEASESIAHCVQSVPVPAVLAALAAYIIVDAWYPLVSY